MPRKHQPSLDELLSTLRHLPPCTQPGPLDTPWNRAYVLRERLSAIIIDAYEGTDQIWMARATLARAKDRWRRQQKRLSRGQTLGDMSAQELRDEGHR
jgi:hypothetical protein